MKRTLFTFLAFLIFSLPLLAEVLQAQAPVPAPAAPAAAAPDKTLAGVTQVDLGTYFGISAAVVFVVGALKYFFPGFVSGKEPRLGLLFSYVLGVSSKLFIPGSFKDVNWIIFLVTLLGVAAAAKLGHDYVINSVVKGKSDPSCDSEDDIITKTEGASK